MTATVDLGVTILPTDHANWKLFPGEGYKFLLDMLDSRAVFLDVRDLNELGEDPREWDDDDLLEHISVDRWSRQNADRDVKARTQRRVSQADRLNLTLVKGLLQTAKKGDLVLVPHPGSTGAVSIGQFTDAPGRVVSLELSDEGESSTYLGRRVKWLPSWSKRSAPESLVDLLQTPVSFFGLGDLARQKIYTIAFGSFVHDGVNVASFYTQKELFTSRDNRLLSSWIELMEALSASTESPKAAAAVKAAADLYDIIDLASIDDEDRMDLAININSPGSVLMRAIGQTPLVAIALFPMAVAGLSYTEALNAQVTAPVVGSASDACVGQVAESVQQILRNMGAQKWRKACQLARATSEDATVRSQSRLRQEPPARRRRR
jgi:hypothetical protein